MTKTHVTSYKLQHREQPSELKLRTRPNLKSNSFQSECSESDESESKAEGKESSEAGDEPSGDELQRVEGFQN
ncbi:unnamed protein product [Ambrosiozyma monospora]|uniref:Unnamed protein product n=1 Tax=Ambrosiozyma monospora TaxID=43982 RepID=A0A9W6YZL6_AMBMO|nr:unnamed protein product [Ambrosiozyma monospora]